LEGKKTYESSYYAKHTNVNHKWRENGKMIKVDLKKFGGGTKWI